MATTKTKKAKGPEVKEETLSILLNVPKDTYFAIKDKADLYTRQKGKKMTIHDQMIEDLKKQNPVKAQ